MPISLRIDNLWKSYSAGVRGCSARVWALRGCSLNVELAERVAVVGARGSGKSTLVACIAGARRPDAGRIDVILPIRVHDAASLPPANVPARLHSPSLLLLDGGDVSILHRPWSGPVIVTSRDVASVQSLVDRVVLLRDGRLTALVRPVVRRVAERRVFEDAGATIR